MLFADRTGDVRVWFIADVDLPNSFDELLRSHFIDLLGVIIYSCPVSTPVRRISRGC